ncbi:MAG TPA: mechanosensitive ion channel family protein [Nitrospiria bacterium]|nr:mechanosensitive ion channel family protein [Nitrospiria bacterium]
MSVNAMENLKTILIGSTVAFAQSGLRILFVVVGGLIAIKILKFLLQHLEAILLKAKEATETVPGATRKRVSTLVGILATIGRFAIWATVLLISLDQVGVNVAPLIAGAGIAGLAFGFGAQNLVRDVISGFFMILEDQVRVGDVAIINGTGGLVEAITFRTIVLRDLAAVVHVFPNGSITTLSNMTKVWSAYVIDVGVAYKEDTDKVAEVMRQVAEELRQDPTFAPKIMEPIEIFGVDNFGESEVTIKARLKTLPIEQWNVGREYRRRLKKAFDAQGIEIPFPHRSLYVGEATKPLELLIRRPATR